MRVATLVKMLQDSHREHRGLRARLTPAATAALVAVFFVTGCAKRDSATVAEASRPSGQQLFFDNCASCHGRDGRGEGPLAAGLRVAPANLRLLAQQNDGRFPARRTQSAIDGRGMPSAHGLPEMPVWGKVWKRQGLTEAQVRAQTMSITAYLGTLQD